MLQKGEKKTKLVFLQGVNLFSAFMNVVWEHIGAPGVSVAAWLQSFLLLPGGVPYIQ